MPTNFIKGRMKEKYKEIILLKMQGKSNIEIMSLTGYSKSVIEKVCADVKGKEFRREIEEELIERAKSVLIENVIEAAITITKGCKGVNVSLNNIKAAELNLKYVGLEPAKKIDANISERVTIIDDITEDDEDEDEDI